MAETDIKRSGSRWRVAAIIALLCLQAWLSGAAHAYCEDVLSMVFSTLEIEIVVPIIGLCVAAYVGVTAAISMIRQLNWQTVAAVTTAYALGASILLATLTTANPSKTWVIVPVLGSAAGAVIIGLTVRRISPLSSTILGVFAAAACFVIAYAMTPFTGSGACGFAP